MIPKTTMADSYPSDLYGNDLRYAVLTLWDAVRSMINVPSRAVVGRRAWTR